MDGAGDVGSLPELSGAGVGGGAEPGNGGDRGADAGGRGERDVVLLPAGASGGVERVERGGDGVRSSADAQDVEPEEDRPVVDDAADRVVGRDRLSGNVGDTAGRVGEEEEEDDDEVEEIAEEEEEDEEEQLHVLGLEGNEGGESYSSGSELSWYEDEEEVAGVSLLGKVEEEGLYIFTG